MALLLTGQARMKQRRKAVCVFCGFVEAEDFFSFPTDAESRQEWGNFCGMAIEDVKADYLLCDEHFKPEDFCTILLSKKVPSVVPERRPRNSAIIQTIPSTLRNNIEGTSNPTSTHPLPENTNDSLCNTEVQRSPLQQHSEEVTSVETVFGDASLTSPSPGPSNKNLPDVETQEEQLTEEDLTLKDRDRFTDPMRKLAVVVVDCAKNTRNSRKNNFRVEHTTTESNEEQFSKASRTVKRLRESGSGQDERLYFKCSICGKIFSYQKNCLNHLRQHLNTATVQKVFVCLKCDKQFARRHLLVDHQAAHSNKRLHQCRMCDKKFKFRPSKSAHERQHVEGARFECAVCGKKYMCKRNLAGHIMSKCT